MKDAIEAQHRTRITAIRDEAASSAGTLLKIVQECNQVLEQGGGIAIQPKMAFVNGSVLRMQKDLGAVEFMQQKGAVQKKQPK